jgi:copper/silver efflux system protein
MDQARQYLEEKKASGELIVPPGVSWRFAGTYEHQVETMRTMRVILPVALMIIFLILYFQFRSVTTTFIVFSGIAVAWAGGFIMIYLYGQDWFADFRLRRQYAQPVPAPCHQSVRGRLGRVSGAVRHRRGRRRGHGHLFAPEFPRPPHRRYRSPESARRCLEAGMRRVRPCLMTSATTILALLPVMTATGRGADIMIPMAIPIIGGMSLVLISMFIVFPCFTAW